MAAHDDLDLMLVRWIDDPTALPAPAYLGAVLERTRRTRQRPAWASLDRWLPTTIGIPDRTAAAPVRVAWLLLIGLLVVALVTALAIVGSRLLRAPVEIPTGGSAVYVFASIGGGTQTGQTSGDIFTVRADGTDLRQLTSGPGVRSRPTFSPDGTRIAYRSWLAGTNSIVVADAGGGNPMTVASNPATDSGCPLGSLSWPPDGRSLIFPADARCDSANILYIVPADGSTEAARLLDSPTYGIDATWSPDGTRIAFLGSDDGVTLGTYVADVGSDGGRSGSLRARRVGPGPVGTLADTRSGPRWSPDGGRLVSIDDSGDVFVMRADGSDLRVVSSQAIGSVIDDGPPGYAWSPVWSPDGRRIAFVRVVDRAERYDDRFCTVRAWVVDADGTNERRLEPLADQCDSPLVWSPDGTRLAMLLIDTKARDEDHAFHLSMVTIDGSEPIVTLGDSTGGTWQPVVAPLPPAPSFATDSPTP